MASVCICFILDSSKSNCSSLALNQMALNIRILPVKIAISTKDLDSFVLGTLVVVISNDMSRILRSS